MDSAVSSAMRNGSQTTFGINLTSLNGNTIPQDSLPPSALREGNLQQIINANAGNVTGAFGATTDMNSLSSYGSNATKVNPHIPVPIVAARWKDGELMKSEQKYFLMLIFKSREPMQTKRVRGTNPQYKMKHQRHAMVNVPVWNYLQACNEEMPRNIEDVTQPDEVWKKWQVGGFVISETGQESLIREENIAKRDERIFNICGDGFAHTVNTWGRYIKPQTKLYLILKKQEVQDMYFIDPFSTGGVSPKVMLAKSKTPIGVKITNKPFQLSFWADYRYEEPPKSVLTYTDEFGVESIGKAIYIGRVDDTLDMGSSVNESLLRLEGNPEFDVKLMHSLPQITIHFNQTIEPKRW